MTIRHSRRGFVMGAASLAATGTISAPIPAIAQGSLKKALDVKIINTSSTMELAFEKVMERQGYLAEMGVNAKTFYVSDGSKILASLVSGEMDICAKAGFGPVLPAVQRGGALKVIAGAALLTPQGVLTNRQEIRSIPDLRGKKIGTGPIGALEHQLMVAILLAHGVDPGSVTFVNVGTTTDVFRSLSAGVIDAGPVNIDVYSRLKPGMKIVANFWKDVPDFPFQGSFTSVAAIKSKRETLTRTLAAYCKLYRFLETPESKDPYIKAYVAAVDGNATAGEQQWQFLFDNKVFATDLLIPDRSLAYIQDLNLRTNVQKTKLPLATFADMSLARDAVRLIS